MLVVILTETSRSRIIMEIARLVVTSLVYAGYIDGRHLVSWLILLTTPLCIWCYPTEAKTRMLGITLGLFCPLALLSASYEPLFLLTLAFHLLSWSRVAPTNVLKRPQGDALTTGDLTEAAFLVSFSQKYFKRSFRVCTHFFMFKIP